MEQNNNFKWYILNVMAGQEKKIAGDIKTLIMKGGAISKDVSEVIVPTKPIIKINAPSKTLPINNLVRFLSKVLTESNLPSLALADPMESKYCERIVPITTVGKLIIFCDIAN